MEKIYVITIEEYFPYEPGMLIINDFAYSSLEEAEGYLEYKGYTKDEDEICKGELKYTKVDDGYGDSLWIAEIVEVELLKSNR